MSAVYTPESPSPQPRSDVTVGLAAILRMAYEGSSLWPLWTELLARVTANPTDTAALMDMSIIAQASNNRDQSLELQAAALQFDRVYRRPHGRGDGLKVAAFVTLGDFMANTPIDFLLQGSDIDLRLCFVDAETPDLSFIPECDVAFLAVGESAENRPVLANCARLLAGRKVLNGDAARIAGLTRDGVSDLLAGEPSLYAPAAHRVGRDDLARLAIGLQQPSELSADLAWPIIARPIGTHAGQGMEKLDGREAASAYLEGRDEQQFYVSPFVDYSGPDGLFRKQRIAFIDGRAFPSHYAVQPHWMVHYLSAEMAERPERRAEEAAWMADFDTDFAARHAVAFEALHRRLGLDYFGIDCAEAPDGRLLVFEVDVAMIVHDLDPEAVFPYKKPAMHRLFAAFQAMLASAA
ncbi:RimK family alpha-L-glutamate ligase [Phenylobacterium sp.]|uniref:ATP-grasp domain-containing protein n=1 Tax=Phenylobacterium sp. TaxID=1871053 RepID=UPI003568080F